MPTKLTRSDSVEVGDLFTLFKASSNDYRGVTTSDVLKYMQDNLVFAQPANEYTTQYASPSSTGFNVTITDGSSDNTNVHLILTPTNGFATGTITLPIFTSLSDKQLVLVNTTQQVTSLTVDKNGADVIYGAPTSLGADDFFTMKYDLPNKKWYRVG